MINRERVWLAYQTVLKVESIRFMSDSHNHNHNAQLLPRRIGAVLYRELDAVRLFRLKLPLPGHHVGIPVALTNGIADLVHLTWPLGSSPVRCTELEFSAGKPTAVSARYDKMMRDSNVDPETVAKRALSAIGSKDWRYSPDFWKGQDCEAFVIWCITGERRIGVQAQIYGTAAKLLGLGPSERPRK